MVSGWGLAIIHCHNARPDHNTPLQHPSTASLSLGPVLDFELSEAGKVLGVVGDEHQAVHVSSRSGPGFVVDSPSRSGDDAVSAGARAHLEEIKNGEISRRTL